MAHDKKFDKESQDARRRDQHNEVHPDDKMGKDKSQHNHKNTSDSKDRGKK